MVPKHLGSALLYENDELYALVNPKGTAVYVGTENRCTADYFKRRMSGKMMFSDADVARTKLMLKSAGWQIVPVRLGVFTKEVGGLARLIAE